MRVPDESPDTSLRVVVVDDEPHARADLTHLLDRRPDVKVVAVCAGGNEAVAAIGRLRPDLALLDIRMPGLDGFGVVARLDPRHMPYVVFVTAWDQFAVEAFRVRALDYLLKPVHPARLDEALARARERLRVRHLVDWASSIRDAARQQSDGGVPDQNAIAGFWREIIVPTASHDLILKVEEIDWIEADTYYVRLHVGGRSWLLRERMHVLAQRLDPRHFVRVHRSAIVNLERIRRIDHGSAGDHVIVLTTGDRVKTSRRRWSEVRALIHAPKDRRAGI